MNISGIVHKYWARLQSNSHMKQASSLFVWNLIAIPLNLAVNWVVTRYMGAKNYGDYLYIQRIFEFAFIVLNFGLFRSVNRAILLEEEEKNRKEIYGAGFIIWACISTLIVISLYVFTLVSTNIKDKGIFELCLIVIPFCSIYYLQHIYEQMLPANNKIDLLIKERYYPRIGLFICAFIIYFLFRESTNPVLLIWTFFILTQFLVFIYIFLKLKPDFHNAKLRIQGVFQVNKEYGFKVYVGDLFSTAFTALMPLLISLFCLDNTDVGFYSLALMLCTPMNMIPGVLATSHYREFSKYDKIPTKIFKVAILSSVACLIGLWIIIAPFVNIFYTDEYHPVILLTIVTSIGTLLYGFSDFLSRYLTSQGDGVALRNSSFIVGFFTLTFSLFLIPKLGGMGAAVTHVIAGLIYTFVILFYYKRCVERNKQKTLKINE